jgi:chemotaxis response regulator CheB
MARYEQAKDILIVDDDREFVQLICRYLQSSGREYNVRCAYDGDEGWRSLCQQPPDLLLLAGTHRPVSPGCSHYQLRFDAGCSAAVKGFKLLTGFVH